MKIGSPEHVRFKKFCNKEWDKYFSENLLMYIYKSKKEFIEENASSSFEFYYSYTDEELELPYVNFTDRISINEKYFIKYDNENSSKFDEYDCNGWFSNNKASIEDISFEHNTFSVIVMQEKYREDYVKKYGEITGEVGKLITVFFSPSIDDEQEFFTDNNLDEKECFNYDQPIVELVGKNKSTEIPIVEWSPSNDKLYTIMYNQKDKVKEFMDILYSINENLEVDVYKLVEEKLKLDDSIFYIHEIYEGYEEYYCYKVDVRIFFSIIKQIMITQEKLYPRCNNFLGAEKFIEGFKNFIVLI